MGLGKIFKKISNFVLPNLGAVGGFANGLIQGEGLGGALQGGLKSGLTTAASMAVPYIGNAIGSLGGGAGSTLGSFGNAIGALGSSGNSGWGNLINAGANIYSGIQGASAAKDMAKAQTSATQKAIDASQPYLTSGLAANTQLSGALGLNGEDPEDIMNLLRNSPGYQFRLGEGTDAINKSLAAKGGLFSGNAIKESQKYGQGLADQSYNNYIEQLMQQSGSGQQAAGAIGGLYQDQGNIQANKINSSNNSINQALAGIVNGNYGKQTGNIVGYDPRTGQPIYG